MYTYNDETAVNFLGFVPRYKSQFGTDYYENGVNANWTPPRYAIEFDLYGQDLCIRYKAATSTPVFWVWVDGKPCTSAEFSPVGITPSPGSLHRIRLQFASSAVRRIRVYCNLADYGGIEVPTGSMCTATPPQKTRLVVVGDSWVEGNAYTSYFSTIFSIVGRKLGVVPYIAGQGGTGYQVNGGHANKGVYGSTARVSAVAQARPTSLVIFGSINDSSANLLTFEDTVYNTIMAYKVACPLAKVFVVGVECISAPPSETELQINSLIKKASARSGAVFIDMLNPAYIQRASLVTTMIGADGGHPTVLGAAMVANRLTKSLSSLF